LWNRIRKSLGHPTHREQRHRPRKNIAHNKQYCTPRNNNIAAVRNHSSPPATLSEPSRVQGHDKPKEIKKKTFPTAHNMSIPSQFHLSNQKSTRIKGRTHGYKPLGHSTAKFGLYKRLVHYEPSAHPEDRPSFHEIFVSFGQEEFGIQAGVDGIPIGECCAVVIRWEKRPGLRLEGVDHHETTEAEAGLS
jgi:hypothetical protein